VICFFAGHLYRQSEHYRKLWIAGRLRANPLPGSALKQPADYGFAATDYWQETGKTGTM
jgi:hypothetical protein